MNLLAQSSTSQAGSGSPLGSSSLKAGSFVETYKLSLIPREEFNNLHSFVQACFDEGRQKFNTKLKTISTDIDDFPACHRPYLARCDALGVSMADRGMTNKEFHIWITPSYEKLSYRFYMTLAHEMVHGYAGLQYGHNAHWRRWFYRVLWHLNEAKMIPEPESELRMVAFSVECSYNHSTDYTKSLHALPVEAFAKAEEEHGRVLKNFWKRINAPSNNSV